MWLENNTVDRRASPTDQLEHLVPSERVQCRGRLVEHEQLGPGHDRRRDAQALEHAAGEGPDAKAGDLGQAHVEQRGVHRRSLGLRSHHRAGEVDDLPGREPGVEPRGVGHHGQSPAFDPKADLAGRGSAEPGDEPDQRAFAGSVRSDQPSAATTRPAYGGAAG
jgi:hypothetical protein